MPTEAILPADGKPAEKPRWDADLHELWLGEVLIKRFRHAAPTAERILATFQQLGWPRRIDDPLNRLAGHREKRRLDNAVHNLNRRLDTKLMHFETDGLGKGVCWRRVG